MDPQKQRELVAKRGGYGGFSHPFTRPQRCHDVLAKACQAVRVVDHDEADLISEKEEKVSSVHKTALPVLLGLGVRIGRRGVA